MDWEDIVQVISKAVEDEDLRAEVYVKLLNLSDVEDAEEARGIDDLFDEILDEYDADEEEDEEEFEEDEDYDYDDE